MTYKDPTDIQASMNADEMRGCASKKTISDEKKLMSVDFANVFTLPTQRGSTTTAPYPLYRVTSRQDSDTLYMVLGVVLGLVGVIVIIVILMFLWRRHQHKRLLGQSFSNKHIFLKIKSIFMFCFIIFIVFYCIL